MGVGPMALLKEQTGSWRIHPPAMWMSRSIPGNKHGTNRHRPDTESSCSNAWHPQSSQPNLQTGPHPHLTRVPKLGSLSSHCFSTCPGTIPSLSSLVLLCLCFQLPGFLQQSSSCLRGHQELTLPLPSPWGQADPRHFCCCWLPQDTVVTSPLCKYSSLTFPSLCRGLWGFHWQMGNTGPEFLSAAKSPRGLGRTKLEGSQDEPCSQNWDRGSCLAWGRAACGEFNCLTPSEPSPHASKQSQTSKKLWLSPGIYSLAKLGRLFGVVQLSSSTRPGHTSRSCSAVSPSHSWL